jgi:hypothetical protein
MDGRTKRFLLAGVIVAAVLAGLVSFYASSSPDGLERVATDSGIADREREHPLAGSPLGDYGVAGIANERLSGGLAGLIGMTATFALGTGVFWAIRRRSGDTGSGSAAGSGSGTAGGSGSATAAGRAE